MSLGSQGILKWLTLYVLLESYMNFCFLCAVQSNPNNTTPLSMWRIVHWPNFLVLIYPDNTTMMLMIQHFLGLICHMLEVIHVHPWGAHMYLGSNVINTLEHAS